MSNKSIPLLISTMAIALVGIIIIQYRWIDNSLEEKQKLIDKNVMLAVSNVEQQLNDHRTLAFISDSMLNDFSFKQIIEFGDTQLVHQEVYSDSSINVEVNVMGSHSTDHYEGGNSQIIIQNRADHVIDIDSDSLSFMHLSDDLGKMESLINRMKIEVHSRDGDIRLDSTHVEEILSSELAANDLGTIQDWGIFDNQKAQYLITPQQVTLVQYDIPLFTTDLMSPGRYDLQLRLNTDELIWKEITFMVILSLIFILIISLVFAYSIRLLIKHKKISQIKSDFINNMTHEFKTPLASISLAADSLLHPNNELNKSSIEKYVSIIKQEKNKLNQQVERILEVASLNKDALDIPISSINLVDVIESAFGNLTLYIEKEQADITFNGYSDLNVIANAYHLENVIVNLIENGIKYSEGEAKIDINISEENDSCLLTIKDHGIGMTREQITKAFDNFYRVQSGNLHDTKGFGLGLSYAKLVIEKMNGSVELKSSIGNGTEAIIKLKRDA